MKTERGDISIEAFSMSLLHLRREVVSRTIILTEVTHLPCWVTEEGARSRGSQAEGIFLHWRELHIVWTGLLRDLLRTWTWIWSKNLNITMETP